MLAGEWDPVTPPIFGDVTRKTLKNSTFIIVPSASHAGMFADDCIMRIAKDFISYPHVKPNTEWVGKRPKIKFVTSDLLNEIDKLK